MNRTVASALLMLGMLPFALWSQEPKCDSLRPLPGSSFQYKDRGNRCEGLYVADVGGNTLELVSFQLGPLSAQFKTGQQLQVSVPGQSQPVHVRAVAIPVRSYYQMDALLPPGATLSWPVDDVLLPEHLGPERIGVFAWKGSEADKVYMPVRIVGGSGGAHGDVPSLTFRPSFDVEKIMWRSASANGAHCSEAGPWHDLTAGQVLAGQPVRFSLTGLKGAHCIQVEAEGESSNDWVPAAVRVEISAE